MVGTQDASLDKILEIISLLAQKSAGGRYIFRGEPECYDRVSSSLYRQYRESDTLGFDIEVVQRENIKEARKYTDETDEFEILTQLQHYGGKTNLIDFTTDYLISLFFACDGRPERDGRIIMLKESGSNYTVARPRNPVNRIIAQKSVFVRPALGFVEPDHTVTVPSTLKEAVLNYLRTRHGISTETIYNDLLGFIRVQDLHKSAYVEFCAGVTSQDKEDYKQAIGHYSESIRLDPQMFASYNNRGNVYYAEDDFDHAIQDYDKALALQPNDAEVYYNRGVAYFRKGYLDLAIQDYNKALILDPYNAVVYRNRGNIRLTRGDFGRAIQDYDKALVFDSGNANTYVSRGIAYSSKGDHYNAIQDYGKALALDQDNAKAYYTRGNSYRMQGHFDLAIQDYKKALELGLNHADLYHNRGSAYHGQGHLDLAIQDYDKALELGLNHANPYHNRGSAYHSQGHLDLAIRDYDKALELNPNNADIYNSRAGAYLLKSDIGRAVDDCNKALALDPNLTFLYYNRSIVWLRLSKWTNARSDLTVARSKGFNIATSFQEMYGSVEAFERQFRVKLPADIASMLTVQPK